MDATRILIEVTAGIIPGTPEPLLTRRYGIKDSEWSAAQAAGGPALGHLIAETTGTAQGYATLLMLQPNKVNWVRSEYLVF